jgi:RND family efflux transporter MFP subunit
MKLKLLLVVLLLVVGAGATVVALGGLPGGAAAASTFLTTPVARATVTDDAAATGTVQPSESYGLCFGCSPHLVAEDASEPSGDRTWTVTELEVAVGDLVTAGQVLARADTTAIERELADAANALGAAWQQLRIAEEALEDAEGADARRLARISVYNARSQHSQARIAHDALETELAAATITSPIAGRVSELVLVSGLDAPSGDAIVVQSGSYEVQADVVESDLPSVDVGQQASVSVDAVGAEIEGTVTAIAPDASSSDSGVVTYAVTVALSNPPAEMRPGMTADVTITLAQAADVLTVPASALLGAADDHAVRVLGADGTPELRPVTVGLVTNTDAEIRDGLAEGELVITGTAADRNAVQGAGGQGGIGIPGAGPIVRGGPRVETAPETTP